MALAARLSALAANAAADAVLALLDAGYLRVYSGTQPAFPDTPITDQVLLVECRYSAQAYGSAVDGVATAGAITTGTAIANGTARWCRSLSADGVTPVLDGSVGQSGANVNLNSLAITVGTLLALSDVTYTQPRTV